MELLYANWMSAYRERLIDPVLAQLLSGIPAVMLVGPRAVGKTTTAVRHARTVVRLDRPAEAAVFRADPDAALARNLAEPVLLDEWQAAPEVLGAVKRGSTPTSGPGASSSPDRSTGCFARPAAGPGWAGW